MSRRDCARILATGFGIGRSPVAPGTAGSLAGLLLALALETAGGLPWVLAALPALTALGYWAIREECGNRGPADPPEVVIDEVVGQLTATLPLSFVLHALDVPPLALWPGWLCAFLLFRLFDILKPWPISVLDRRQGPFWVLADDIAAGILAAAGVLLAGALYHGMFAPG